VSLTSHGLDHLGRRVRPGEQIEAADRTFKVGKLPNLFDAVAKSCAARYPNRCVSQVPPMRRI
jgi:hypothetical protein